MREVWWAFISRSDDKWCVARRPVVVKFSLGVGCFGVQTVMYGTVECAVVAHSWFFGWGVHGLVKGDKCNSEGSNV